MVMVWEGTCVAHDCIYADDAGMISRTTAVPCCGIITAVPYRPATVDDHGWGVSSLVRYISWYPGDKALRLDL